MPGQDSVGRVRTVLQLVAESNLPIESTVGEYGSVWMKLAGILLALASAMAVCAATNADIVAFANLLHRDSSAFHSINGRDSVHTA